MSIPCPPPIYDVRPHRRLAVDEAHAHLLTAWFAAMDARARQRAYGPPTRERLALEAATRANEALFGVPRFARLR